MPLSITGAAGELRWSYAIAATLVSWSIDYDSTGVGKLSATVVAKDAFRASQRPLTFVARSPKGHIWRWELNGLQIAGTALSASLVQ
jgi:hypothetical protein